MTNRKTTASTRRRKRSDADALDIPDAKLVQALDTLERSVSPELAEGLRKLPRATQIERMRDYLEELIEPGRKGAREARARLAVLVPGHLATTIDAAETNRKLLGQLVDLALDDAKRENSDDTVADVRALLGLLPELDEALVALLEAAAKVTAWSARFERAQRASFIEPLGSALKKGDEAAVTAIGNELGVDPIAFGRAARALDVTKALAGGRPKVAAAIAIGDVFNADPRTIERWGENMPGQKLLRKIATERVRQALEPSEEPSRPSIEEALAGLFPDDGTNGRSAPP